MASSNQVFVSYLANIRVLSDDNCIIARERPVKPIGMGKWKVSYDFAMFPDAYALAKYLIAQPVGRRRFHEVIRPGRQKVFVDIDLTPDKAPDGDHMAFGQTILQLMIQCMESYCQEKGIPFDLEQDVAISTSHCATKFSAHIIFPHHLVVSTDGEMRYFVEHELCGVAKERPEMRHALEKLVIDLGVYARTHNFRIVYSDKVNDKGRILAPADEFEYYGRRIVHTRPMDAPEYIYLENIIMFCHRDRCFELSVKVPKRPKKESTVEEDEAEIVLEQLYENLPIAEGTFELRSVNADIIQLNRLLPFDCPACKGHHDGDNPYIRIFKYRDSEARYASLCCRAKKSIKFYCLDPEIEAQPKPLNAMAFAMAASFRRREGIDDDEEPVEIPAIIPEPKRFEVKVTKLADIQYPTIPNPSPFAPDPNLRAEMEAVRMRKTGGKKKPVKRSKKPEPVIAEDDDEPIVQILEKIPNQPGKYTITYDVADDYWNWSRIRKLINSSYLVEYYGVFISPATQDRKERKLLNMIKPAMLRGRDPIEFHYLMSCVKKCMAVIHDKTPATLMIKTPDDPFHSISVDRISKRLALKLMIVGFRCSKKGKPEPEPVIVGLPEFLERFEGFFSYDRAEIIPYPNDPDNLLNKPLPHAEGVLNTFSGFRAKIVELTQIRRGKIQKFLDHLKLLIAKGDDEIYRTILWWFREVIVENRKPNMALMVKGEQGAGKGVIFRMFGDILGPELYLQLETLDNYLDKFNDAQRGKLMVYIAEFGKVTGSTQTVYNKFKSKIDEERKTTEGKYKKIMHDEINRMGVGASSNDDNMIAINKHDRRMFLLECSDEVAGDAEYWRVFHEYYPLQTDNKEKNLEMSNILYSFMHSQECRDIVFGRNNEYEGTYFRPPETEFRKKVIADSRSRYEKFFDEVVNGEYSFSEECFIERVGVKYFIISKIFQQFKNWCESCGYDKPGAAQTFGVMFGKLVGKRGVAKQISINDKTTRTWIFDDEILLIAFSRVSEAESTE